MRGGAGDPCSNGKGSLIENRRIQSRGLVHSLYHSGLGVRRTGPDSLQWCPVTGQGAMGTNWSRGSSSWTGGTTSSLWGWRSPGTGCPGRLWSLLLWRYSRPAWTRSCAACSGWPCFGRRVGLGDPQRSLPTPTILWFCDSCLTICTMEMGEENLSNALPGSQSTLR